MAHIQFVEKNPPVDRVADVNCFEDSESVTINSYDIVSDPMTVDLDVKSFDGTDPDPSWVNKVESYDKATWDGTIEVA